VSAPSGKLDLEVTQVLGGSYKNVRASNTGGQVHHLIAAKIEIPGLSKSDYPSVYLESFADHKKTASWGRGDIPDSYRQQQQTLINQGEIRRAIAIDIRNLRNNFGTKYNEALLQSIDYAESLKAFKKQ
jgi:hypothetical protein